MNENWYDTAQICLEGHVVNAASVSDPIHNKRFCDRCGKATMKSCPHCTAPIRGVFHGVRSAPSAEYALPAFCHGCGRAFPWKK
jgi:hypothetical protein